MLQEPRGPHCAQCQDWAPLSTGWSCAWSWVLTVVGASSLPNPATEGQTLQWGEGRVWKERHPEWWRGLMTATCPHSPRLPLTYWLRRKRPFPSLRVTCGLLFQPTPWWEVSPLSIWPTGQSTTGWPDSGPRDMPRKLGSTVLHSIVCHRESCLWFWRGGGGWELVKSRVFL